MAAPLVGLRLLASGTMRLAPKLVKRLRQEYIDDIGGEDLIKEMTKAAKKNNLLTPKDKINKAFDYINKADSPAAGKSRMKEMFEEFVDVDNLIEDEVGSLDKAFIKARTKKAMGGMMYNKGSLVGNQSLLDKDNDGEITGKDFAMLNRTKKQKGSLLKMPYAEGGDVDEGADVEEKPSYSAGKKEQTGGGGGGEIGGSSFDPMAGVDPMGGVQTSADLMSEPGGRGSRVGLAFDRVVNVGRNVFNNLSATGFNAVNTALKAVDRIPGGTEALAYYSLFGPTGARAAFGLEAFDKLRDRITKQEGGSLMVPPEMESDMPMDTYPNIPPEEMAEAEASQLPDAEMEDKYMDFVLDQSLDDDEQSYLMNALEDDPKLSQIFDKVITTASEFTGAGEVEGPGTGVSDSIPARLSDGEFVFTKKATDQMGADNLQMMMDDAERAFDGGKMRSPKQEGGMMYKQKDEDPLAYEKIAQDEIKKNMLRANRAPSLLGGN